jgi:hypothetical protein
MLITQTYLARDVIQDLNDYPTEINLVVSDNKPELLEEISGIIAQLSYGEMIAFTLSAPDEIYGVHHPDAPLLKVKHDGKWFSLSPLEGEGDDLK